MKTAVFSRYLPFSSTWRMKGHFILISFYILLWFLLYQYMTKQTPKQLMVVPYSFRREETQLYNQKRTSMPMSGEETTMNTPTFFSRKPNLFQPLDNSDEVNSGKGDHLDLKSGDIPSIYKSGEFTSSSNPKHVIDNGMVSNNGNASLSEGIDVVGVVDSTPTRKGLNNNGEENDIDEDNDYNEYKEVRSSNLTSANTTTTTTTTTATPTPTPTLPPDLEQEEAIREILNYNIDFNDTRSSSRKWDLIICTSYGNTVRFSFHLISSHF